MSANIIVVGSSNTDMVIKTSKFPLPGETLLGGQFLMNPGGKGANQAVAAARLGGAVTFIAKVGQDIFGQQALQQFKEEGINTDYIKQDPENPSGVALITVDSRGENTIVVASGANAALLPLDLKEAEPALDQAKIILLQLEIPMETVGAVIRVAKTNGTSVILNPAPATALPDEVLQDLFLITPNETEAETLTGIKVTDIATANAAAEKLMAKGVGQVIITLGAEGACVLTDNISELVPTARVQAIDTTAAGDVFNGALAVALAEGQDLLAAVKFACGAAAISVTRMGAQASAPYRQELTGTNES